ncbi:MAG: 4a-hydroxytetrahydrobiopterin dehydratase [Rhodoferax sp.]
MNQALSPTALVTALAQLPGWQLSGDGAELAITRRFVFADYAQTMAFVNAVAWLAQARDHHPELEVGYGHCTVRWRTHDVGGVTTRDVAAARAVQDWLDASARAGHAGA